MRISDWSSDVCSSDLGASRLHILALVVDHRANLAAFSANHEDIADVERAAVDQNGRHGATALVELGLNDRTFGGAVWIGLPFHDLGLKHDFVDQGITRSDEHTSELQSIMSTSY